tara:strand:- start:2907 stop:3074 length:168 start_codon:yes stop_codon:yes gene_type:complete
MEEHPIISFLTGGGLLMAIIGYTVKTLLTKIECLKRSSKRHDIDIAVLKEKTKKM